IAAMTSASPPQTIHSIERVGLFMIGLRLVPGWIGRVCQVPLLGGVRGGFMDQVCDRRPSVVRCGLLPDPLSMSIRLNALNAARLFQQGRGSEPKNSQPRPP